MQVDKQSKPYFVLYEENWVHEKDFHQHERAQLVYVLEGFQNIHVHDNVYLVPKNHVIWVPPNLTHKTITSSKTIKIMTLFFKLKDDRESFYNQVRVFSSPTVLSEMLFYAEKWSMSMHETREEYYFLKAILYELPHFWNNAIKLSLPAAKDPKIMALTNYLQKNYDRKIPYNIIADEHSMSQRTMERLFKKDLGITVSKYIQILRIIKSLEFLSSSNFSIQQISDLVGYQSAQAFSNSFLQIMHYSPQLFRKNTL
ncbi:helix-turn-helix domain-containing protein [Sphingobacterium sp. UT-1RO-CII-1]|uniref:AraC family transcriptional regulator n=1 Tax=Sphingobacterium sp. UT-1RO-CII-1 TaxID=2995225 RepID=UPI00227CF4C6|nr:helix-turn-helix domain-containing protein [Sphingobacterium sp. UT-1RO-CII-1]MCY4778964.1 helix-turn-helix domain-containing protein [Sphingobacterium sp. UT-1RO-CII-1]